MKRREHFREPIGTVVSQYLRDHGETQAGLAFKMNVDQSTVSRLVSRDTVEPLDPQGVRSVERLAEAMGLAPDSFFEYRLWKVQQVSRDNPQLADRVYDLFVAQAAAERLASGLPEAANNGASSPAEGMSCLDAPAEGDDSPPTL